MKRLKQAGKFLCSMKCAVTLLLILTAACTVGSLIPQGEDMAAYSSQYPEAVVGVVLLFGLDDVFHSWWFVGLTLFLCANLLCCNVLNFPAILKRMRDGFTLEKCLKGWDGAAAVLLREDPEGLFADLGFQNVQRLQAEGRDALYGARHKAGLWGAWLCHLGMLVVIVGFGLGQLFQDQYIVYGVPGQTRPVGDTGYELRIDDFEILLREDATVEQYTTSLTVFDRKNGDTAGTGGKASVNEPLSLLGMKFYQNSTGWAANLEVWKAGEKIQESLLCAGEYALVEDRYGLAVMLNAFYPDFGRDEAGNPVTLSPQLSRPGYLYTLYYHDKILGMNTLTDDQKITVEEYTLVFSNPQPYTLIQIKRDPFGWLAAVGGLTVLLSLLLAFYLRPEELWALKGEDGIWRVCGKSRREGAVFQEKLAAKGRRREEGNHEQ